MKPNSKLREMKNSSSKEVYGDVTYHWLPIHKLIDFHIYPEFFNTELIKPVNETQYCITKDGDTAVVGKQPPFKTKCAVLHSVDYESN